jgi:hypothetical protein
MYKQDKQLKIAGEEKSLQKSVKKIAVKWSFELA